MAAIPLPKGLPRPEAPFIGRARDVADLQDLVSRHRLVSVVGAGGCGKTRLVIETAADEQIRPRAQVAWVDLAPIADDNRVPDAVSVAIGARPHRGTADHLAEHLADDPMLLVFDNCEHVAHAVAPIIDTIHQRCPRVHMLATSREPLVLGDEVVWRLQPLGLPDGVTLEAVEASASGLLLLDRIRRARPGYEPDVEEGEALARICTQLDGIPLALELAAARTATLAPAALAARLSERFGLLTGGGRNVLPRQRTLEASVAWSHELLDPSEATVFRRLAVFAGSFSLSAATHVVGDDLGTSTEVTDLVLRLVERSLLVAVGRGREPRFRMLDTLRHFGRERLVDAGDAEDTRARHLAWFQAFARDVGSRLEGPDALALTTALDHDLDNLRTAMAWATERGEPDARIGIAAPLSWYWIWRGRLQEGIEWLEPPSVPGPTPSPPAQLEAAWALEQLAVHFRSEHDEIARHANTVRALAAELDDPHAEGRMLVSWGMHIGFLDPREAFAIIEQGRELCVAHNDRFWAAYGTGSLALCLSFEGRHHEAAPYLQAMGNAARTLRNPQLVADHIARQSLVDLWRGDLDAVVDAAVRMDRTTSGLTEINVRAIALTNAAHVETMRGRAQGALAATDALFERYQRDGEAQHLPGILLGSAAALTALDRGAEARERLEALWRFPELRAAMPYRLWFRQAMAVATYSTGARDDAYTELRAAADDAQRSGSAHDAALAERFLAVIERERGDHGSAQTRLHRALDTHVHHGYPQPIADVLEELAGLELDRGQLATAATLLGASRRIRADAGVVCRVGRQHAHEADVAAVRAALTPDAYHDADTAGASMTLDAAVAYTRRGRGPRRGAAFGWSSLTATETQVAELAAQGLTNPQIAAQLLMGRETVKSHMASILRKLSLRNRAELAKAMATRQ